MSLFSRSLPCFLAVALLFTLPACSGSVGSWQSVHYERSAGGFIAKVRARGIHLVSLPGASGLTVGLTDLVAFYPGSETPDRKDQAGFLITLPPEMPMHVSRRVGGLSAGWNPTFTGFSAGVQSTSVTRIDPRQDLVLLSDGQRNQFFNRTFSLRTRTHNEP